MVMKEFHHNEIYDNDDLLVESVDFKKFFSKIRVKVVDLLSKIRGSKELHSSGAKDSIEEMVKEFSFYNDNDYIVNEFSFGPKPNVTYKKLETIINYFYTSIDANFKFDFEVADIALEYGQKALNAKSEEDVNGYYNEVVKQVNSLVSKYDSARGKTAQYSKDIVSLCKKECKYVRESLTKEELDKLAKLCVETEKKVRDISKEYDNKVGVYLMKSKKLLKDFNKVVDDKSYEKRCAACVNIMGQIFEGYAMPEYKATQADCTFTINDVNYIYKNIK